MTFKDFEEFKKKIHPFYGFPTVSKKCELFKYIEELEEEKKDE